MTIWSYLLSRLARYHYLTTSFVQDTAVAWAIAGAHGIVLVGRNQKSLLSTSDRVKQINSNVKVLAHSTNTASEEAVKGLYEAIGREFSEVDVLINAAGAMNDQTINGIGIGPWWNDFVSVSWGSEFHWCQIVDNPPGGEC